MRRRHVADTNVNAWPVLIIRLDHPEARNAFNAAMAAQMKVIVDRYEADDALRVAVLRAEGPTFCPGQDLKAADRCGGRTGASRQDELTRCCDMVVASMRSVFGLAEVGQSLIAIGGGYRGRSRWNSS